MTEYGRGYGSEPWHPEDPLYGETYGDHGAYGGQASYGNQDPYAGQGQYAGQDPYAGQQPQHPEWGGTHPRQQYDAGWDAQQGGGTPYDPYAQPHPGPYDDGTQDYYGAQQQGYPQHQHPGQHAPQDVPHQAPPQGDDWRAAPEPDAGWGGPEEPWADGAARDGRGPADDHAFFAGDDAEDDEEPREGRRSGRERRGKQKQGKRRRGRAVAAVVLVAAVAGGGYLAYDRFGPAPDFDGEGSGSVKVEIPDGSPVLQMGVLLRDKGVVKSADAFTAAVTENPKAKALQPGVYTMRQGMSAASAVELMLSPESRNNFTIPEGSRAVAVYERIDKKLGLKSGTTKGIAAKEWKNLGLPSWANDDPDVKDPLEGFLYPSQYEVNEQTKPADLLKQMVHRADQQYEKYDLEANAEKLGLKSPLELVTVASLTQAEGMTHDDFRKMAEVVYNRLDPSNPETWGRLEFDSTYNYIKNQSELDIPISAIKNYDNPYNTYYYKGLPPGPIGNPGADALKASVNPTDEGWYYFVAIDGKTKFAKTYAEHEKLVEEFNKTRRNG